MSTVISPRAVLPTSTTQTTVTGLISDPGGNPATGGTVTFVLSPSSSAIAFRVAGTSIFAPRAVVCQISPTGQLLNEAGTGPCLIWGNPAILPGNTTYTLLIAPTVNGSPLTTSTIYGVLIFGSTYDLSNIQFAPNVEVTPQQTVLRADPVEANLVPVTGHVFNLGSQQLPYANIFADNLTLSDGSLLDADNIQADNIAADNITTSNLAATNIATSKISATTYVGLPPPPTSTGIKNVKDFGAKGDGSTDDTSAISAAINAAASAGGGTVFFPPPGPYRITSQLLVFGSNIVIDGGGSMILYNPTPPLTGTNGSVFVIEGTVPGPFNLIGTPASPVPLNLGTNQFTALNASDAAALQPNDWVILSEKDTGQNPVEVYFYDQYQVASVSGAVVTLQQRIRTIFPGTHSVIQFQHITKLTQNITIRNLTITSTYSTTTLPVPRGIYISLGARTVVIDNVVVNFPSGNAIATYLTADLKIVNSTFNSGNLQSTELAATVDMLVDNNVFDFYNQPAQRAPLTIDFGTGFSSFNNNVLKRCNNFGLGLFFGVHDCTFVGNTVSWVLSTTSGSGVSGVGCYNNTVVGNVLIGADGASSQGIAFSNDSGAIPPVLSHANRVASNQIGSFVYPTGIEATPSLTQDTYLELTTFQGSAPLLKTGRALQLVDTANNAPFLRLSATQEWQLDVNTGQLRLVDITRGVAILTIAPTTGNIQVTAQSLGLLDSVSNNPFLNLQTSTQAWSVHGGANFAIVDGTAPATVMTIDKANQAMAFFNWAELRKLFVGSRSVLATDYTPNPIPAGGTAQFVISVVGARTTDMVVLGTSVATPNTTWSGWVSANDAIQVVVANPTTAPITPSAATWNAMVILLS